MSDLLEVDVALKIVLDECHTLAATSIELTDAVGLILAEAITSDIDSPPYDKAMMDGYAVRTTDLENLSATFIMQEEIMAGQSPTKTLVAGTCARIMTGAPIPKGCDAVIMVERTSLQTASQRNQNQSESESVETIQFNEIPKPGQNIMRRGASLKNGATILTSGTKITPARVGLLAEVGRASVSVVPKATVAVLSTGNELVNVTEKPGAAAIRNSNGPMLVAAVKSANADPLALGIARDDHESLREKISNGLNQADILILSGGVSAGKLDLVPSILEKLGVRARFHKIKLKPGKPLWFGVLENEMRKRCLVFGLPGNPVSSMVCFQLFVEPAIRKLMGHAVTVPHQLMPARLAKDFVHKGDRPTYFPGVISWRDGERWVEPAVWQGSADLAGFTSGECLIRFPEGSKTYAASDKVSILTI